MKLTSSGVDSITHGDVETNKFGFIFNGKMADILSSKLYTDKYYAPVRELICNARDAHVAAGTEDKPFVVHLPCRSEPYFSVRDYGTGLTHDEVVRIFTQYGATTKDDTNEAIGCLGLGSKSPFAYTDEFQVWAYKDGVCNIYLCLKESGVPEDKRFNTCKTTEPNGVEVRFNVSPQDFSAFSDRLAKMFFLRDYMKVVDKSNSFSFLKIPPRMCAIYDFLETDDYRRVIGGDKVSIEMGGVIYKVESQYGEIPELDSFNFKVNYGKKVLIHAEIGDVDVAISREHVELTKKTKQFIKRAIKEFEDVILGKVYNEINKEKGFFRKILRYKTLRNTYGEFAVVKRLTKKYEALCRAIKNFGITSIIPRKRTSAPLYIYNQFSNFTDIVRDMLSGKYPTFVDVSQRSVIPPEIRAAANATDVSLHCIRDVKLILICKKLGIPVKSLADFSKYKPARKKGTNVSRKDHSEDPTYISTSGFSTELLVSRISEVKDAYAKGASIWWFTDEQRRTALDLSTLFKNTLPPFLRKYPVDSRYHEIMNNLDRNSDGIGVVAETPAAIARAEGNSRFINIVEAVKEFMKDKARIKQAVEYAIYDALDKRVRYFASYGVPLCKLFIEKFKLAERDNSTGYTDLIPYIKQVLILHPTVDNKTIVTRPSVLDRAIIDHLYSYPIRVAASDFEGTINDYISKEIPLIRALLRSTYMPSLDLSHYSPGVQEDINEYLRVVCRRLTKELKEASSNTNTNNN